MDVVSVIVPIYNQEKYLDICLQSIIHQTYTKLQIILVNDGSTDNSLDICKKYEKDDERIVVINKNNGGLSDARNVGIDYATGEYIVFIDSDDMCSKRYIETLYSLCKSNDAEIVQCDLCDVDEQFNICDMEKYDKEVFQVVNKERVVSGRNAVKNLFNEMALPTVVACTKIYKTEIVKNIQFDIGRLHEDVFFTYKALYAANRVVFIEKKLYFYRKVNSSITNSKYSLKRLDLLDGCAERFIYFEKEGDKKLYALSLKEYYYQLITAYYKIGKYLDLNDNNVKIKYIEIKNEIKKMFWKLMRVLKFEDKSIIRTFMIKFKIIKMRLSL